LYNLNGIMNSLQIAYFIVFIWGGGEPNEIPGSRINQTGNSNSQGTVTSGDGRSNNEDVTNSVKQCRYSAEIMCFKSGQGVARATP
jgi:hypothetical protein